MNILITGANGLVGRRLTEKLSHSHKVHAVVRTQPENPVNNVTYHIVDFSTDWTASRLPDDIETVFHLAQSENFRNFPDKALDIYKVNIDSTARLLDYAHKNSIKRFVYASSGGVYGSGSHAFHENSPITAHSKLGYYLGSKLCSEILVENYAQHMLVNILRFFFVYGPEQKRSMLIPRLVDSVKEGRPITLQGEEGISINPIHVSDAVLALEKILTLGQSSTINIAGAETLTLKSIANTAGEILGKKPVFHKGEGEGQSIVADTDLMKSMLITPSTTFRQGLSELI